MGAALTRNASYQINRKARRRGETVFLMISRLVASKGVLDYIEAAKILKHDRCRAHFRILGPFDDHPTAVDRDTIQSAVDSGTIEYCGTTTDVRPYLQDADVFVLPSYREGTPRSSLEALAMATPIITTDSPGCRETVIHDSNGYLVPVRDPVALSEAMRKLSRRARPDSNHGGKEPEARRRTIRRGQGQRPSMVRNTSSTQALIPMDTTLRPRDI